MCEATTTLNICNEPEVITSTEQLVVKACERYRELNLEPGEETWIMAKKVDRYRDYYNVELSAKPKERLAQIKTIIDIVKGVKPMGSNINEQLEKTQKCKKRPLENKFDKRLARTNTTRGYISQSQREVALAEA